MPAFLFSHLDMRENPISSDEIAKGILELAGNKEEMQQFVDTLRNQDYGNQEEIKGYEKLLDS